jgi:hypothetical protein
MLYKLTKISETCKQNIQKQAPQTYSGSIFPSKRNVPPSCFFPFSFHVRLQEGWGHSRWFEQW